MAELQHTAPGVKFELRYSQQKLAINELLAGHLDFALGFSDPDEKGPDEIQEITWFEDRYIALARKETSSLSLEDYLAARHLVVTPWNEAKGVIDYQLEKMGLTRHIAMKTPSVLSSPFIVAQSDLLMTIPRFAAEKIKGLAEVKSFPIPFYVPPYRVKIYSHRNSGKSEANQWLQSVLTLISPSSTQQ